MMAFASLFSQAGIYLDELEWNTYKVGPYLDSVGVVGVIDETTGEYGHKVIIVSDDQAIAIANDSLYLEDGGSIYLGDYLDNTDDQNIEVLSLNPSSKQLTMTLEDGNTRSVSLFSLQDRLSLINDELCITGTSNCFSLSPYLDNTDDQQIETLVYDNGLLTLTLEDGGTRSVNIGQAEIDPIFLAHIANTITADDIDRWNTIDGLDTLRTGQTAGNNFYLEGPILDGVRYIYDFQAIGEIVNDGGNTVASDDQFLSLDGDVLNIENGNGVDLSKYANSTKQDEEVTGITSDTYIPTTVDLSTADSYEIFLNGEKLYLSIGPPSHIQQINVNGNVIQFYEDLESSDVVYIITY